MFYSVEQSEPFEKISNMPVTATTRDILVIANITENLRHCVSEITGHSLSRVHYNEQIIKEHNGIHYRISVICPHLDENPSGLLSQRFPNGVNLVIFFGQFPDFKSFLPFNQLILHFTEELRQISVIAISSKFEWNEAYQQHSIETLMHMCPDLVAVAGLQFAFLTATKGLFHSSTSKHNLKEIIQAADAKVSVEGMILPSRRQSVSLYSYQQVDHTAVRNVVVVGNSESHKNHCVRRVFVDEQLSFCYEPDRAYRLVTETLTYNILMVDIDSGLETHQFASRVGRIFPEGINALLLVNSYNAENLDDICRLSSHLRKSVGEISSVVFTLDGLPCTDEIYRQVERLVKANDRLFTFARGKIFCVTVRSPIVSQGTNDHSVVLRKRLDDFRMRILPHQLMHKSVEIVESTKDEHSLKDFAE